MKKNQGFTLVEVLVSVVILAILGVVFFQFFALSQKAATNNEGKMGAVTLAEAVLEQVKNGEYPEITTECDPSSYPMTFQNHRDSGDNICDRYNGAEKGDCINRYEKTVNKERFFIEIEVGSELEDGLGLHSALVKVYGRDGNLQTSVRGAVKICRNAS